jgi:hypothetical protein
MLLRMRVYQSFLQLVDLFSELIIQLICLSNARFISFERLMENIAIINIEYGIHG